MDLQAALDATKATGPGFLEGLGYLLRSDRKKSRLTFLQPYDYGGFAHSTGIQEIKRILVSIEDK